MANSSNQVSKLIKWFCYTVAIGLIPTLLRFGSSLIIEGIVPFSAADFIAFGFVLHISIFNELEHMTGDETWKSVSNTMSLIAVVLYGALMFSLLIIESGYDKIRVEQLTTTSMAFAGCSFVLCFIIFHRLSSKAKFEELSSTNGEDTCSQPL